MKKIFKSAALLLLALMLALPQAVFAEETDEVKGIFRTLLSEGTSYSEAKAFYQQYFPASRFVETLKGESFTISVSGNDYMNGSWTFVKEGDYLTVTMNRNDLSGKSMVSYVLNAVGKYYGVNTSLLNGYIAGLSILGLENPYLLTETDTAAGTTKISISMESFDMFELEEMELTEDVLARYGFGPLGEDYISRTAAFGKLNIYAGGTVNDAVVLLSEYEALDDQAYQAILSLLATLQPVGWEDFAADYTSLRNAKTANISVSLNVDDATARKVFEDLLDGYANAVIRFKK